MFWPCRITKPLPAVIRAPALTVIDSVAPGAGASSVTLVTPLPSGLSSWPIPPAAPSGPVRPAKEPTFTVALGPNRIPPVEKSHTPPRALSDPERVESGLTPPRPTGLTILKAIQDAPPWLKFTLSPAPMLNERQSITTRWAVWFTVRLVPPGL